MPAPVPGTVVSSGSAVSPGGDTGLIGGTGPTGPGGATGPGGPTAVSADANNLATLGSDNLILVPASKIWSARLRSYNAFGNPTFEIDQQNVGASSVIAASTRLADRWKGTKSGTMAASGQQTVGTVPVPGTNFLISQNFLRITLTTAQATLGGTDSLMIFQVMEGIQIRELLGDVHSGSILVRSSVAGLAFTLMWACVGTSPQPIMGTLCTIPNANTWTLIPKPNLPVIPGSVSPAPGQVALQFEIVLAAGASYPVLTDSVWQSSTWGLGIVSGQSNFAASPVNSTFDIAFAQHEPGAICTTFLDKPFNQNLDECLRYYQKTHPYSVAPGGAGGQGYVDGTVLTTGMILGIPPFQKAMAKIPAISLYNASTGAAGTGWDHNTSTATAAATALSGAIGEKGFPAISSSSLTAGHIIGVHYTADTAW
jgi:hypothetical protein